MAFPDYALRIASDPTLRDVDHFSCLDEHRWFNVGVLRRAQQTPEQLRTSQRHQEAHMTIPDPYAAGLRQLRAAIDSTESSFEEQWRADRTREMESMRRSLDRDATPAFPVLSTAELHDYSPPDPYGDALRKMKETK